MKVRGLSLVGRWNSREVRELIAMLRGLPKAWVEDNPHLHAIARQPALKSGPSDAPGHSKYEPSLGVIVVYDKGVYHGDELDPEQFRRSVYHELGHSVLRARPELLDSWQDETDGDGFVDDYAKTSPTEDFCDTFSEFFIQKAKTSEAVPRKAAFMQKLLDDANQEKVAMSMIYGFADELTKTAALGGLRRMMGSAMGKIRGRSGLAKGIGLAGGGGLAGAMAGKKKGEKKGYEEGTGDVMDVAQRARLIGRREGAQMYHNAMIQRMRQSQAGAK